MASWYTNVWLSMGGEPSKLAEDVKMNILTNNADHGHHHGLYSNESDCSFDIPENKTYKKPDKFIPLTQEQLNSEEWLKDVMRDKKVKIEKYINKQNVTEQLSETKNVKDNTNIKVQQEFHTTGESKELEQLKNLLHDRKSLNDFM